MKMAFSYQNARLGIVGNETRCSKMSVTIQPCIPSRLVAFCSYSIIGKLFTYTPVLV